jgi:hypothetical protein
MFWRRLVATFALALVPMAICLAKGFGFLALLSLVVACWPWPVRASVDPSGITLRWLFLKEVWSPASISSIRLRTDPRRWAWPRRKLLVVERADRRAALLFAPEAVLLELLSAAASAG